MKLVVRKRREFFLVEEALVNLDNGLEFNAFTNIRMLAPTEGGELREATKTETFVGAWE